MEATVYGIGNVRVIEQLLGRDCIERVCVVIMALDVAWLSLSVTSHHRWLVDSRVTLEVATPDHTFAKPFVHNPALLDLADPPARRIVESISLHYGAFQANHVYRNHMDYDAVAKEIEPFVREDGDVASLFGTQSKKTVIVVAGGPSTDVYVEALRALRDDVTLVSLITAYPSLIRHGLVPDLVLAMDPGARVEQQLGLAAPAGYSPTLVYFPSVAANGLRSWPYPRLVAFAEEEHNLVELAERYPRGRLSVDGSTTVSAISLAIKLGASKVWLLGADFAYLGGKTHSAGVFYGKTVSEVGDSKWTVEGYQGDVLVSSLKLIGHLRSVEALIADHPDVEFRNISEVGAKIEGAAVLDALC